MSDCVRRAAGFICAATLESRSGPGRSSGVQLSDRLCQRAPSVADLCLPALDRVALGTPAQHAPRKIGDVVEAGMLQ